MNLLHLLLVVSPLLSGCMFTKPVKRVPLGEVTVTRPPPHLQQRPVVLFEEVVPGKPFNETVWDSATGSFWNQSDLEQIGVDIPYPITPIMIPGAVLAAATEAQRATWFVPFGPILSKTMMSALERHFLGGVVCYDTACVEEAVALGDASCLIKIRPSFQVWTPAPTSLSLNYASDVTFDVYTSPSFSHARSRWTSYRKRNMKLNPIISYMAISEIVAFTKEFAEEIVSDILTKAFR